MTQPPNESQQHRFGEIAKEFGFVTDQQIGEALKKQESMRAHSAKSRLGEVFMFMNILTLEQVRKVTSEQRKRRQADTDKHLPMDIFGDFKLLEKLGEGGMGAVYKAQEVLAERIVALKVLRKNMASNHEFVQRFDREAKLAGSLSHPNVVASYSAGTHRGVQYLAMEYVEGEDLHKRMSRSGGKLKEREGLTIIRDVALGLGHAHKKGLVHRDVKPENILLAKNGVTKLADFGTAKSFLNDDALSQTGVVIGTPYYISPEQVRGEKDIDHRADLYALGATLYHVVSGKVPFYNESVFEVMRAHLQDELENPADINPELTINCVNIISKLMAKARNDRYADAEELVEDIECVLDNKAPRHVTKHLENSSIRPPRRKKKARVAGCAGALAICISVTVFLIVT